MATNHDRTHLRLLSWNVGAPPLAGGNIFPSQYDSNLRDVAATIRDSQADIAVLQELTFTSNSESLAKYLCGEYVRLGEEWPEKAILPPWSYVLVIPALFHWTYRMNKAGLQAFIRVDSPWGVESIAYEPFENSADCIFEGDGYVEKGLQRIALAHPSGQKLAVLNTHMQAQYPNNGRLYDHIRRKQVDQIGRAVAKEADPVLLAGDFNVCRRTSTATCLNPRDPEIYGAMTAEMRDLTAALRESCSADCATFLGGSGESPQCLDYILARDTSTEHFRAEDVAVVGADRGPDVRPSDHAALLADLEIIRTGAAWSKLAPLAALVAGSMMSATVTRREALLLALGILGGRS